MLSQKDLNELIAENSKKEVGMTPEQIITRDMFHPAKVELLRKIAKYEQQLLDLENRELMENIKNMTPRPEINGRV